MLQFDYWIFFSMGWKHLKPPTRRCRVTSTFLKVEDWRNCKNCGWMMLEQPKLQKTKETKAWIGIHAVFNWAVMQDHAKMLCYKVKGGILKYLNMPPLIDITWGNLVSNSPKSDPAGYGFSMFQCHQLAQLPEACMNQWVHPGTDLNPPWLKLKELTEKNWLNKPTTVTAVNNWGNWQEYVGFDTSDKCLGFRK